MLRSLIIDSERNLLEKGDLLGTMCYADQLADTIKSVPSEQAYTIGLYGTWGCGKSTIIRTAKEKLEEDKNSRIKMIVYDAWKYSGDSFRRMFLLHLQNELQLNTTPEMERFYTATTEEIKPKVSLKRRGVIIALAILAIGIIFAVILWNANLIEKTIPAMVIVTLCTLFFSMFGGLFYELKVTQTKNILFAPEQFEECFRQMMYKVLKEKSWYKRIWRWIKEFFTQVKVPLELDKLVVVIDNLDRCESGVVYSMLTDIKTFLGSEKYDVVFVIPVDHEALKKHLITNARGASDKSQVAHHNSIKHNEDKKWDDADEFLRKFFNVVIKIKDHRSDELMHYINELNRDEKLDFNPNTLALVVKEYTENPRRILQTLNNLTVEQSLYPEDYAKEKETLIAACMILREHYPKMVEELLHDANVVMVDSYYEYAEKSIVPDELKGNDAFYSFMRTAKIALQKASSEDFRKVLTNREGALSNLSDDIRKALDSYDDKEIVANIRKDLTLRADVFSEIKRRIKEDETLDATDSMEQWVECIACVNKVEPLRPDELLQMNEAFAFVYNLVPEDVTKVDEICKLAKDMNEAGLEEMKTELFSYIRNKENAEQKFYHDYVKRVFEMFTEREDCSRLKEFAEDYFYNVEDITKFAFADTQKQYLLTGDFVKKIIEEIKGVKDEKQQQLLVWCFRNLNGIDKDAYKTLFEKFTSLVGSRERKASSHFMNVVAYSMPMLKVIAPRELSKAQKTFFESIANDRTAPDGMVKAIIMDSDMNEAMAEKLADFCLEMYRISSRNLTINPCLRMTQRKCEGYVKQRLVDLKQRDVDMIPFRSNIIEFKDMDANWYELIPVVFAPDKDGKRADAANMKEKLRLLYDNRGYMDALTVLEDVTKDEYVCELFNSILDLNNPAVLSGVPDSLLPRIVGRYTEENAEQFKDNNAMLKIVLQNGKSVQKDLVVHSLIDRINNNKDMDGVLDVIGSYDKWRAKDKSVLRGLLQRYMPEDRDAELTEMQEKMGAVLEKL